MHPRILLLLTASHLHVQRMVGTKCIATADFPNTAAGRTELDTFLNGLNCPAYLLVDLVGEDFHLESMPYLRGKLLRAFLQRKFEQFYRGTPFRLATLLQRQTAGRRDADMLFSALTHPDLITPYLDILKSKNIPLAGIYSVPYISSPLIEDHPAEHLLLVTRNTCAGLRISYFHAYRLQFSRLTPMHEGQDDSAIVAVELSKTYNYLVSLGLLAASQMLDIRIVAQDSELHSLQATLPTRPELRYEFVALDTLAKRLGIAQVYQNSDASTLYFQLLARHPKVNQYADHEHTHGFDVWRVRRILYGASLALIAISSIWFAQARYLNMDADQDALIALRRQTTAVQNKTQQVLHQLPQTDVAPSDMKAAVLTLRALQAGAIPPHEFLTPLSLAMDRYPDAQLDELNWACEPNASDSSVNIILKGHWENNTPLLRATLNSFDALQHALVQRGYRTEVLKPTMDISPYGNLSGPETSLPTPRTYALHLLWRATP